MSVDSELPLAEVMDLLVDAVCVVDADGCFIFASAACVSLLGYTQAELIGRNMIDFVHPPDRARTLQVVSEIMGGKVLSNFENRYIRKDGSIVDIMWSARWSESRRIRLAVARDVTALRLAARKQNAIFQISEAAHAADDLATLYEHIHRIVGDLMHADSFIVAQRENGSEALRYPYFVDKFAQTSDALQPLAARLLASVIATGEPLRSLTTTTADEADARDADWLGAPLIVSGRVIGALVIGTNPKLARYSSDDLLLLQYISTQIATTIERKQAELRLRHLALHDELTNLPKRTLFNDRLDIALTRARRNRENLALLFLDLNGFKAINDSYGHDAGDGLLREVARRLADCVRESDTVGRIGGDEFMVLLTGIQDAACLNAIVSKVRESFLMPVEVFGQPLFVSASIGVAVYPEHGEDKETLIRHADSSMYQEKAHRG